MLKALLHPAKNLRLDAVDGAGSKAQIFGDLLDRQFREHILAKRLPVLRREIAFDEILASLDQVLPILLLFQGVVGEFGRIRQGTIEQVGPFSTQGDAVKVLKKGPQPGVEASLFVIFEFGELAKKLKERLLNQIGAVRFLKA